MGIVERLSGGAAYLDTNTLIYAVERIADFRPLLDDLLPAIDRGAIRAVTSELALGEALVKPLRDGNEGLVEDYVAAIRSRPAFEVVPVCRDVIVGAARVRAESGLKLPDAIHATTAIRSGCTRFVTNDPRFRIVEALDVMVLSDLVRRE